MRVCFSIYKEDHELGVKELVTSLWVQTNWSLQKIEEHIAVQDGFHSEMVIGENLSFFDYYCFFDDCSDLAERIKSIPNDDQEILVRRTPGILRVRKSGPDNDDAPIYPTKERCYLYNLSRYECGASGFGEVVYWASSHPLEMMFIGGVIYDVTKWLVLKALEVFKIRKHANAMPPMFLNTKRLYRNFSQSVNIRSRDCQITKLHHLKAGSFHVKMRTITNRVFKIKCNAKGKIESLEEIT